MSLFGPRSNAALHVDYLFSKSRERSIAALLCCLLFGLSTKVHARAPDVEKGLKSYEQAMEFYSAADYGRAKKAIEEAHKHDPRPVYLGFRAWCIFRLGDQAEGLRIMNTLSRSKDLTPDERLDFEAAVSRMKDHAGTANLNFRILGDPVEVILNGESKTSQSQQYSLSLVPGSHSITFKHPKHEKTHDIYVENNQFMELTYEAPATIKLDERFGGHAILINNSPVSPSASLEIQSKAGPVELRILKEERVVVLKNLVLIPGKEIEINYPQKSKTSLAASSIISSHRAEWIAPTVIGIAGTGMVAGAIFLHDQASTHAKAVNQLKPTANNKVYSMSQSEALSHYRQSKTKSQYALLLYGLGGLALSTALAWSLWPEPEPNPKAALSFGAESIFIRGRF